jgi:hypothetical protein
VVGCNARVCWATACDPLPAWKLHCVKQEAKESPNSTAHLLSGTAGSAFASCGTGRGHAGREYHSSSSDVGNCVHMISSTFNMHVG